MRGSDDRGGRAARDAGYPACARRNESAGADRNPHPSMAGTPSGCQDERRRIPNVRLAQLRPQWAFGGCAGGCGLGRRLAAPARRSRPAGRARHTRCAPPACPERANCTVAPGACGGGTAAEARLDHPRTRSLGIRRRARHDDRALVGRARRARRARTRDRAGLPVLRAALGIDAPRVLVASSPRARPHVRGRAHYTGAWSDGASP